MNDVNHELYSGSTAEDFAPNDEVIEGESQHDALRGIMWSCSIGLALIAIGLLYLACFAVGV